MDIAEIHVENYRSVRSIRLPLRRLTVLVGENGAGKTNLYRALQLIHAAAAGSFASELAAEGGLASAVWAGERKTHEEPGIRLGVTLDRLGESADQVTYDLEVGFPPKEAAAAFQLESQIKSETLAIRDRRRSTELLSRKNHMVFARDDDGVRVPIDDDLMASETALNRLGHTGTFPEVAAVQRILANWRFFHSFRTDEQSALRRPTLPVTSPMLNSDGSNLAAVFATLFHIREDTEDLRQAVNDAFPGAELIVPEPLEDARFEMSYPDFPKRRFAPSELSDGTLQYLALMGVLLSYRLPAFLALNEPETSLHPSLLPALGRLIAKSAERTQILVVTHSRDLANAIEDASGVSPRTVIKRDGATWLEGLSQIGIFMDG